MAWTSLDGNYVCEAAKGIFGVTPNDAGGWSWAVGIGGCIHEGVSETLDGAKLRAGEAYDLLSRPVSCVSWATGR